jgi:hypothetical protein
MARVEKTLVRLLSRQLGKDAALVTRSTVLIEGMGLTYNQIDALVEEAKEQFDVPTLCPPAHGFVTLGDICDALTQALNANKQHRFWFWRW